MRLAGYCSCMYSIRVFGGIGILSMGEMWLSTTD